jgi:hypothetical protein
MKACFCLGYRTRWAKPKECRQASGQSLRRTVLHVRQEQPPGGPDLARGRGGQPEAVNDRNEATLVHAATVGREQISGRGASSQGTQMLESNSRRSGSDRLSERRGAARQH